MFELKFETNNEAFKPNVDFEISKIFSTVLRKIVIDGATEGWVLDSNGNNVGFWKLEV